MIPPHPHPDPGNRLATAVALLMAPLLAILYLATLLVRYLLR